jgi:hypothetical protein
MTLAYNKPTRIRGNIDSRTRVTLWRVDKVTASSIDPANETPRNDLEAAGVEFTAAIKKAFRGCELHAVWSGADGRNCKSYVYMPGDTYCMGYVTVSRVWDNVALGYEEHGKNFEYTVTAHTVTNHRHADLVLQQTCKTSNPKKAVANAKKYLRRVTHEELTKITSAEYHEAMTLQLDMVESELGDATDALLGLRLSRGAREDLASSPLLGEMFWQIDAGTMTFLSPDVEVKLKEVQRIYKEIKAIEASRVTDKVVCVQIHEVEVMGEKTHEFSTAVVGMNRWSTNQVTDYCRYTEETLPEDIAGKIAVLAVCGMAAVIGVGYRYDENIFYVIC